jgi:hypothetical protein
MKRLIHSLLILFSILLPAAADVVYLNEGEEIIGRLHKIENNQVTIEDLKGESKKIKADDIAHILMSKIRTGDDIDHIASLTDPIAAGIMKNLPDSSQFKDADYVTLYRLNDYEYTQDNRLITRNREIIQILKEPGLDQANQSIYYFSDREKCDLEFAHTYSTYGKVYHITDDAVSDENLMSANPEYDRLKRIKMALKKVDIGSVIDYSYTKVLSDLDEIKPYSVYETFGEREPVLHEEISITFPEDMPMKKVLSQWSENAPQFHEKKENGKQNWKWIYSNPRGFIPEQNMLPVSRIFPRVVIYREHDWKSVSQKLSAAYEAARPSATVIRELLAKAQTDKNTDKFIAACRLYDTINREIRDVDMSITQMGSFAPVSADVTWKKKYANTQAMLALLHFALEALDIDSYPGFSANKREITTIKDHQSLGLTDYALLKIVIDGKVFYTDGGSAYKPFATLATWLQGATAIFHDQKNSSFSVEVLPQQTYDWNRFERTVLVKILTDGTMQVNEVMNYRGPYESGIRELKSMKDKEKRNYAERRIKRVHPKAVLNNFALTDLNDMSAPVVMNLDYTIPEAAQLASDRIMTFTNFWVNYQSGSASLASRTYPMQYWACEENQQTVVFELPENFHWINWNRQYQHRSAHLNFLSNINQNGNRLIYTDRFSSTIDEFLTDASYQNYRQCILTMSELANQWIILEKQDPPPQEPSEIASPAADISPVTSEPEPAE